MEPHCVSAGCRLFSDRIKRQSEHKRKALKRGRAFDARFRRLLHKMSSDVTRLAVASGQHLGHAACFVCCLMRHL